VEDVGAQGIVGGARCRFSSPWHFCASFLQPQLYFHAPVFIAHPANAMVHYLRFLSPPQVSESQKKVYTISVVIAVTTDLGDALFPGDVDLSVRLVDAESNSDKLCEKGVTWTGTSRALKVALQVSGKYASRTLRMHVASADTKTSELVPHILDVWSMAFEVADKQRAEPLVDRELSISTTANLRIREETGESIARHIWDASLGFLLFLQKILNRSVGASQVQTLISGKNKKTMRILELGSGCGIVGIAFTHLLKCDMLLTDLDDATDILQTNIKLASPKAGSSLRAEVLDWSSDLHDSRNVRYDLVLVSDCIYNPESSVYLVETLQRLARSSPQVLILVGFKRRHFADDVFFDHMKTANFDLLETDSIPLPHAASDYDATLPAIEFYTYRPSA
jgi:Lysine methyltransferase